MNRISRIVAGVAALGITCSAVPALAQYANEYSPPKVIKQGTTSHNIAGSGTVQVKVQVNPNGTHKVIGVLKSTNSGDNAAALDIAQSSTYSPAHRGTTPVVAFYDYNLRFNGKAVVESSEEQAIASESGGTDASAIDALIHAGKYQDAITKANTALLSSPGNPAVLQLLGVAQFYNSDFEDAAKSFSRVSEIKKPFQAIAAQAYSTAAVRISNTDPAMSLQYANSALALAPSDSTPKFALGVAQLANKQYPQAVATLKAVHDRLTDPKQKASVDQELLQAYLATNDQAGAATTIAEMKSLDPAGAATAAHAIAQHELELGSDAVQAKQYADALKDFDQAADAGGTEADTVTANTYAALAIMKMDKPDYEKAKDYALKAVAASPSDPTANFYTGIAYANIYVSSHKSDDRTQALNYLNKADQLAKAAGNIGLSLQIENQIKNVPQ